MNIHINDKDKAFFISKNSIPKFKEKIRNLSDLSDLSNFSNYLIEGYEFFLESKEENNVNIKIKKCEKKNEDKTKKIFELMIKELKNRRLKNFQKNFLEKKNLEKRTIVMKEYEKVKGLTTRPLLNPNEVYSDIVEYYDIVKNLCDHFKIFGEDNPFFIYYKILLKNIYNE